MKKFILILCLLTVFPALTACSKESVPVQSETSAVQTATEETVMTEAAAPITETLPQTPDALYVDILDAYYYALETGWGPEKYMEANLNYLPGLIGDPHLVGYYMEDLDGDHLPELLIGAAEENYIYAMYTMKDGSPQMVLHASERNTYQVCSDGAFFNRGSNGAASAGYNFYTFYDGQMHFQDALMYDANADPENPWFYAMDEDWDVSNDLPYGTGDAEAHVRQIEASLMEIPYVPFSDYKS